MNHKSKNIWAHTLFQNEERWLWYSVSSVIDHVDRLLLWNAGSSDLSTKIARELKAKYFNKIDLKEIESLTPETFYKARQEMLDATKADWFLMVDGDEIWWDQNINKLISAINIENNAEAFVVPFINLVGDIFHFMDSNSGRYNFGNLSGNYALRAIKRNIEGLKSFGTHGVWGWADKNGNQIQDRNTYKFIDAPYLHTTHLKRGDDQIVAKRIGKLKYELGNGFAFDYYYPEVFFKEKPDFVKSPWETMDLNYKLKSVLLTPLKKIRRKYLMKNVPHGY